MSALSIRQVAKQFGRTPVLDDISLEVDTGTVTAILGPSGCGKTTLLRLVTGFERPDRGTITVAAREVSGEGRSVAPHRRGIGYVAQDGALFPHLDVARNICFGLPWSERRRRARVRELLALVSLDHGLERRYPDELSGGQQQRVALARALAPSPSLILLDEPFSALDTGLRVATRSAVADALRASGVTTVLVTHDQDEALSFADQIAVMDRGRFSQVDSARTVYESPVDLATARMLGVAAAIPATARDGRAECALGTVGLKNREITGPVTLLLRPEQIELGPGDHGTVVERSYSGATVSAWVQLAGVAPGQPIQVRLPGTSTATIGDSVNLSVIGPVHVLPPAAVES